MKYPRWDSLCSKCELNGYGHIFSKTYGDGFILYWVRVEKVFHLPFESNIEDSLCKECELKEDISVAVVKNQ